MTTVLVCEDHRFVRESLCDLVAGVPGVDRVVAAASGEEAIARCASDPPDLVLMDLRMPGIGGLEATRRVLADHPQLPLLVLSAEGDDRDVAAAIKHGARGYLLKDISHEELRQAISSALRGVDLVEPSRRRALEQRHAKPAADGEVHLTERELQVLRGMSQGKSNGQIGRELYLSEDTIKTHARRLFRKLGVNDRAQAVALGFRRGLVS
ncbi:MAG: response regulator [Mycobacteriales bacterium]|nr:response regulator transcription factor [Frankia sp.]